MFNVIVLGIASFLTDVSSEMVYPLIPLYLASIGASSSIIGFIEGLAESIASLLKVFSGYWSDRIRQRKSITIIGYATSTLGKFLLFLATTWHVVLLGRVADRFGKGIRTAPRDALIADPTDPAVRGHAFGLHRALDSAGASLGAIVAFLFLISLRAQYQDIFLLAMLPGALGVIALYFVREKIASRAPDGEPRQAEGTLVDESQNAVARVGSKTAALW
jgi:MFS family permease